MSKKITHFYPQCIGCGACTSICPQFFELNHETYKAELIGGIHQAADPQSSHPEDEAKTLTIDDADLDDATRDMLTGSCPVSIIEVTEGA